MPSTRTKAVARVGAERGAISTRERLKRAARRLFAERGIEGTTVRDILVSAGEKNGASLNYYFVSKDELIRELTVDVFTLMDDRWRQGLTDLRARGETSVRAHLNMLVSASDTSDVEDEPTTARFAETVSHQRYHLVRSVLKDYRLKSYDLVLEHIAAELSDVPPAILRQRLLLLTRYLSTVFALYESARIGDSTPRSVSLPSSADLGNLVDTAYGLITAEVVSADSGGGNAARD